MNENINYLKDILLLNPKEYILIYCENDFLELNNLKVLLNNIKIVRLLLTNEEKKDEENDIIEIYPDLYIENILIENCLCIIYLSKYIRSSILIELIEKNNILVIYNHSNILKYISVLIEFKNRPEIILNEIKNLINNFKIIYYNLLDTINTKNTNINKNIKILINKLIVNIESEKINIVTYYKKYDSNILNFIQKKCITENLKNKNIDNIFIIGNNLNEELNDIINDKISIYNFKEELTYNNIIDIINISLNNKIILLIRSDIIIPSQEFDNIELDFIESNNIYTITRIERLINGNLLYSEKLNNTLFSLEHDAWLFKSPLNINNIENINIENINKLFFYEKYNELYFNKLLKLNNYNIINYTTKYKIIRLLYEDNIENRLLLKDNKNINNDDIYLIPDNKIINSLSIDKLLELYNIDNNDIYKIKCDIFNKYIKNKIIK